MHACMLHSLIAVVQHFMHAPRRKYRSSAGTRCWVADLGEDLRAAIEAHLEEQAKGQGVGSSAPGPEDEQEDGVGHTRLSRWRR